MDEALLDEKLESLRRCLARVANKAPATAEALANDVDAQDIILVNLERAVQTCVDVAAHLISGAEHAAPATMADAFAALHELGVLSPAVAERMIKAVGFRNLAVHEYTAISWAVVFRICTQHLDDFRQFAREVDQHVRGGT